MFFSSAVEIPWRRAKELPKNQSLVLKAYGENGQVLYQTERIVANEMSLGAYLIRPNILSLKLQLAEKLCLQAAQKTSEARRAKFDELRRTLQYVEGVGQAQRSI